MTEIVELASRRSPRRCVVTGLVYPPLYLIEGHLPHADNPAELGEAVRIFTLTSHPEYRAELHNRTLKEVTGLDSFQEFEGKLLIVRYHASLDAVGAYLKGINDATTRQYADDGYLIDTDQGGCFTLVERPCHPGYRGRLIVCVTTNPKDGEEVFHIILPDGSSTNDLSSLRL